MSTEFIPAAAEAIVIRPGDKLILRFDSDYPLSAQQAQIIKDRVAEMLDGIESSDVMVIGCDQIAVFRDEA